MSRAGLMPGCTIGLPFEGQRGRCVRCGTEVPGFRRRWCSEECVSVYGDNHWWNAARVIALRRSSGLPSAVDTGTRYEFARCDDCGGRDGGLEVNHVEPRIGRGYGTGCHNHQTNLQVLCHPCHVAETTRQRRERPIWDALEYGVITPDEAQVALDNAYWWKRGLPDPDAASMDSLWGVA